MAISYPNRFEDHQVTVKMREVIDAVNGIISHPAIAALSQSTSTTATTPTPVIPAIEFVGGPPTTGLTLAQIQNALQAGGSNPLNVSGLTGSGVSAGAVRTGAHATRPTPSSPGQLYFETDRNALYVVINSGGVLNWVLVSAAMSATRTAAPSDLGANDDGFFFYINDYAHIARWDGSASLWRITDGAGGYFLTTPATVTLGNGYHICDGSATDFVNDNTSNLSVTAFTTPNVANQYFRR